jgi:LmbE family N-acetylglucosaminyl deacetylase
MVDCFGARSWFTSQIRSLRHPAIRLAALTVALSAVVTAAASAQVVVFAPHPDDEALIASGIIHRARQNGQTVKVVIATNGDCEDATIGHARQFESLGAMEELGLATQDVIFLGYPDCGLRDLYYYYTTPTSQYTSAAGRTQTYGYEGLGGTDYHTYIYGAPASYNGVFLMQDLQAVLRNYKPQDIYVTSAYDANLDHYALNFLVGEVVLSMMRSDTTFQPTVHEAIVHEPCPCDPNNQWPMPSFTPTQPFSPSPGMAFTPLAWSEVESVEVPLAMQDTSPDTNVKSQALSTYESQGGSAAWLQAFVKRNEIFWKWELWANLALKGTATASSALASGTTADRINDAAVVGFPVVASVTRGGKGEWVANEMAGAWAQVSWPTAQQVTRVVIHDRPDVTENITAGTLTFSDGSSLPVGALPTNGASLSVTFPAKDITWVRFTVGSATGTAAGLAELEVYGPSTSKLPWQLPSGNVAPSITAGPTASPLTIDSAQTSSLLVTGSDANGDPLSYSWSATGGRIEGIGSAVTFVPPIVAAPTTYRITVFLADGRGGIASGWVDLTVNPATSSVNVASTATPTASTEAGGVHGQVAAKAIDGIVSGYPTDAQREWASAGELAGAWIQLTWSSPVTISRSILHDRINTSDQILAGVLRFSDGSSFLVGALPDDGAGLITDFAARTVSWIRFEVTNARGGAVGLAEWEVFTAAAADPNRAPQITAGPTATPAAITHAQTASLGVTATDADGDSLTYSWVPSSGSISGAGATVTFTPPQVTLPTTVRIDVQITDGHGGSATSFVNVSVTPPNRAPQITAGPTATPAAITHAQTTSLSVTATDADGDSLTYSWVPVGGSISGSGATVTFTPPQVPSATTFRIDVQITDGRGGSATSFVNVTVTPPNRAPQMTAGPTATPAAINDLQTASLSVTATDADGDSLTYAWMASGGSISGSGATVTFTPPHVSSVTSFRIDVQVTDGRGGSAAGFVNVSVNPNTRPVIRSVTPGAVPPGAASRVRVTGANFVNGMSVFVSGQRASDIVVESTTAMSVLVPSLSAGVYDVAVVNPSNEMAALPSALVYGSARLDLLWHHQADGRISTWLMNGLNNRNGGLLDPAQELDTAWKVAGSGDLNGDGQADIVWQNISTGALRAWFMDGRTLSQQVALVPGVVPDTNWRIRSVGDWDGDGMADLVWHHQTDGRIALWLMNGRTQRSGTLFSPSAVSDVGWQIVGSGDFNRDGRRDLLWRHADGRLAVWLMNGLTLVSGTALSPSAVADTNWKVRGVGDINGDGHTDLIWQHRTTGAISAWLMNGLRMVAGTPLNPGTVPDTNWEIVGPR